MGPRKTERQIFAIDGEDAHMEKECFIASREN